MDSLPGKPISVWLDTTPETAYPLQDQDVSVDVAVIGGGIVGITAAYLLKRAGLSVCLLERRRLVTGTSGHTTAKVTSLHGLIYRRLASLHGEEKARLYGVANQAALEWVASTVNELGIECDFARAAAYTYVTSDRAASDIEAEVDMASRLGLPASFTTETELPFRVRAAVRFEEQARFHPRKFLLGLAATIPGDGSLVFEETQARDVERGSPQTVITDRGKVRAENVIVATHLPFLDRSLLFARTSPRRHPVVALTSQLPAPEGMYLAYDRTYPHSLRQQPTPDGPVLIVGGESWKTAHLRSPAERWRMLIAQSRERLEVAAIEYRWGAQDYYSVDFLPFVGKLTPFSDRLYGATGFGAWGMTNGIAAGLLLADLVLARPNESAELFDPNRLAVRASARKLVTENVDNVGRLVLPRLRRPSGILASIHEGDGAILEVGGRKLAVSRDMQGGLHAVTPACTHQGCIIAWNDAENAWECPCHGSRFSPDGEVLQGPALENLRRVDLP